jgi:hypothetical protein
VEIGIAEIVAIVVVLVAGILMTLGAIVLERRADAGEESELEDVG